MPHRLTTLGFLALLGIPALTPALSADGSAAGPSRSTVYNLWDPATSVGRSQLVRTSRGISATFQSTNVPPGQAVTLWFTVFNNPAACATRPCTLGDAGNPAVQVDFLWGGGNIVGASGRATFAGRIAVGDPSGSAFIELGGAGIGLLDPWKAEVLLLLHSHGPAQTGQLLKYQLTSYLGGCQVFNGPDGFASGPQDIPDAVGECSTFQGSMHE